jgi:hypothetical protein
MKPMLGTIILLSSAQGSSPSITWNLEIEGYREGVKFRSETHDSSGGESTWPINDGNLRECKLYPVEPLDDGKTYARKLSCEIEGSAGHVQVETAAICFTASDEQQMGAIQLIPDTDLRYLFILKCSTKLKAKKSNPKNPNNQEENNANE